MESKEQMSWMLSKTDLRRKINHFQEVKIIQTVGNTNCQTRKPYN